jgi:hypothetical protein
MLFASQGCSEDLLLKFLVKYQAKVLLQRAKIAGA